MEGLDFIWGIIGIACGGYCIAAWYRMTKKGEICKTILLPQDISLKKCKDLDGYRKEAAPKLLVLGIFVCLFGIFDLAITMLDLRTAAAVWGSMALLIIVLVWFWKTASSLRKKYFGI